MKIKKYIKNTFFFIILYLYLFNPYLYFGFKTWGTIKFLYIFLIIFLFDNIFLKIFFKFKYEIFIFIILIGYSFVWGFFGGGDKISIYTGIVYFIELFLLPIVIAYLLNLFLEEYHFFNILNSIVFFATFISIILFFTPELSQLIRTYTMSPDSKFLNLEHRGFGLAGGLPYSYPIFLGSYVAIIFSRKMNFILQIILLLMIIFSIAINARIGFVPVILSVVLLFFNKKINFIYLTFILSLLIFFIILIFNFFDEYQINKDWILSFFYQISDLFFGTDLATEGTISTLTGPMIILPENFFQWFFGKGYSVYGSSNLRGLEAGSSDVGYIIQLNYGGLFYIFLWLFLLFLFFIKNKNNISNYLKLVFLLTFLISNIKGNIFSSNDFFRFFTFYFLFYYTNSISIKAK